MNSAQVDFLGDQTTSLARGDSRTQNEIIRDYLKAHPGEWIAMPILAKLITATGVGAAVHSRIDNCRSMFGMVIKNRLRRPDGVSKSWYMYEPSAET